MCHKPSAYRCMCEYDDQRVRSFAIYCSDGRFGECYDEFLHGRLGLPHYDRLAIPGGAANLKVHLASHADENQDDLISSIEGYARFLIEAHDLRRIVLIAHEDCGYYIHRFKDRLPDIRGKQTQDLVRAARCLHGFADRLTIEAYYAGFDDGHVRFDPVELS